VLLFITTMECGNKGKRMVMENTKFKMTLNIKDIG